MKRILALMLLVSIIGAVFTGCTVEKENDDKIYLADASISEDLPLYKTLNLEQKKMYLSICGAIESFDDTEILIADYENETKRDEAVLWIKDNYIPILYDHPEYFWVNPYDFEIVTEDTEQDHKLYLKVSYLMNEEKAERGKKLIEEKVDKIVEEAEKREDLFEKVLYVYDYILENTEYDKELAEKGSYSDMGRSAYGCLVENETVCSGYVLAFIMIMNRLGIECGAEFNVYGEVSIFDAHVWNYCKLDGEYYYFDLTWDDTSFDKDEYRDYIEYSHCYFGITAEELSASRTRAVEAITPPCNGREYNYYVHTDASFSKYDREAVGNAVLKQKDNDYISLRFSNETALEEAEKDLMKDCYIFELVSEAERMTYVRSGSGYHLFIIPKY